MKFITFKSYNDYVDAQSICSIAKQNNIWAHKDVLTFVAHKVRYINSSSPFGICHGVRNGFEVKFLRIALADVGAKIIGTEISDVAKKSPFTIQWDFHETKPEWIGAVDFIYSNSFDHSYDPNKCLAQWMSCITPTGMCFLEWTQNHQNDGKWDADCFRANLEEYIALAKLFDVEVAEIKDNRKTKIIMISHSNKEVS